MPVQETNRCPGTGQRGEDGKCPVCDKPVSTSRPIAPHKLKPGVQMDTRSLMASLNEIFEGR